MSGATTLAEVVDDIVQLRVKHLPGTPKDLINHHRDLNWFARSIVVDFPELPIPVVDATALYDEQAQRTKIHLYEDHPCCLPPWDAAWIGYRNRYGNLMVSLLVASDADDNERKALWDSTEFNDMANTAHVIYAWTWCGGQTGDGQRMPTFGPFLRTDLAMDADGKLLDVHWARLTGAYDGWEPEHDTAIRLAIIGTLNLMNCRNIELVRKPYDRPARRRAMRLGGTGKGLFESVLHINTGRTTVRRSGALREASEVSPATRLTTVRGHPAHYGNCCPSTHEPRGLLFGKYTGRVWIPQTSRGEREVGTVAQTFVIEGASS